MCFYSNNTVFPKQQSLAPLSITHILSPLQHWETLRQTHAWGSDVRAHTAHVIIRRCAGSLLVYFLRFSCLATALTGWNLEQGCFLDQVLLDSTNLLYAAVVFRSPQSHATVQSAPHVKLWLHSFTMSVTQPWHALASIRFISILCIFISSQAIPCKHHKRSTQAEGPVRFKNPHTSTCAADQIGVLSTLDAALSSVSHVRKRWVSSRGGHDMNFNCTNSGFCQATE